jgi:hypothetical protein
MVAIPDLRARRIGDDVTMRRLDQCVAEAALPSVGFCDNARDPGCHDNPSLCTLGIFAMPAALDTIIAKRLQV